MGRRPVDLVLTLWLTDKDLVYERADVTSAGFLEMKMVASLYTARTLLWFTSTNTSEDLSMELNSSFQCLWRASAHDMGLRSDSVSESTAITTVR